MLSQHSLGWKGEGEKFFVQIVPPTRVFAFRVGGREMIFLTNTFFRNHTRATRVFAKVKTLLGGREAISKMGPTIYIN